MRFLIFVYILACIKLLNDANSNELLLIENNSNNHPQIREKLKLGDPFILLYNDTYYLYGTNHPEGIKVFKSDDLQLWMPAAVFNNGLALHKKNSYGDKSFWAPEVYLINGKFIMYYSAQGHICSAESDFPEGPFIQKNKVPMTEERAIDNHLFVDDDGKGYIYFVQHSDNNEIWVAELEEDYLSMKEDTKQFCFKPSQDWELKWGKINEGPFVIKLGDTYVMTYSGNHFMSQDYGIGLVTAPTPLGPWEKSIDNPVFQKPGNLVGVGHHSLFTDKAGNNKIVFHAHNSLDSIHPRIVYISDYSINDTGDGIVFEVNDNITTPFVINK